jgi:hypothetical protein
MNYYISVDIGVSWDKLPGGELLNTWGISTSQEGLARKIQKGDVLLHYINHAQVWAGYSVVGGPIARTSSDEHADWRAALPWMIPIVNGKRLSKSQCQTLQFIDGVKDRHMQRAFTVVPTNEAGLILGAIDRAAKSEGAPNDPRFNVLWEQGADAYYGGIRKVDIADCKCEACGADGLYWAEKHLGGHLRTGDRDSSPEWFLVTAHIIARRDGGAVTPDNIRALCQNCHHSIDRLPKNEKEDFMKRLPIAAHREARKRHMT